MRVKRDPLYFARQTAQEAQGRVSKPALRFYIRLLEVALLWVGYKRLERLPDQITLHFPIEQAALEMGLHRHTINAYADELVGADLLRYRAQKVRAWNRTVHSGTVWFIALNPSRKARVIPEDMKHTFRNMEAEKSAGRLSYSEIRHTKESGQLRHTAGIVAFAIPQENLFPVNNMYVESPSYTLETLFDLGIIPRDKIAEAVAGVARAIVATLGDDNRSFGPWCWLLWQCRRLSERGQNHWEGLWLQISQGKFARENEGINNAGAFVRSNIEKTGLLDILKNAPVTRVVYSKRKKGSV